jgi:hypothetical protein
MPIDIEALAREMDKDDAAKPTDEKVDRGDDFKPTEEVEVDVPAPKAAEKKDESKDESKDEAKKDEVKDEAKKDEVKDEAKKDDEPARDPDTGKFIPKARFDDAVKKLRARNEALAEQLREQAEKNKPAEGVTVLEAKLDAKSEEYGQLLADGKLVEAKAVMRDINALNREIARIEIVPVTQQQSAALTMAEQVTQLVDLYKSEYPVFDETSKEHFDQEIVTWVAQRQGLFEAAGMTAARALQEAADDAIARFALKGLSGAASAPKKPGKTEKEADRTAKGVEKALDVAKKQPATLSDVGTDSDKAGLTKIKVSELSYDDFDKLPESTRKRLRGDLL